jgi:hypothetical protein
MVGIGSSKPFGVALVFTGTLAVITYLTGCVLPRTLPSADASSTQGSEMTDASIVQEKQTPLDCRLVPLGRVERKAVMECSGWLKLVLQKRPALDTPHLFRNPLVVESCSHLLAKVEIENTSGQDFTIYPYSEQLFWVSGAASDSAGRPAAFGTFTHLSLGRMVPLLKETREPAEVLKPGQVVSQPLERLFGNMDKDGPPKPGKYTVWAVCSYFRAPDAEDCKVISWPFPLTITEEDIREWKELSK